jgi:hypothetical protein
MRKATKKRCQARVLDHFSYINAGVSGEYNIESCNYCGDAFKRRGVGTDVLKAHLAVTAVACKKVPEDVRELFKTGTGAVVKARRLSQTQPQLGCLVNSSLQEKAARDIALWAFSTGTPFSAIDNPMFKAAMRSVAIAGVNFKAPSRKQLSTTLLDSATARLKLR